MPNLGHHTTSGHIGSSESQQCCHTRPHTSSDLTRSNTRSNNSLALASLTVLHVPWPNFWSSYHIHSIKEALSRDRLGYEGTLLLQQHYCLQPLCCAVCHDPATVPRAEGEATLEKDQVGLGSRITFPQPLYSWKKAGAAPDSCSLCPNPCLSDVSLRDQCQPSYLVHMAVIFLVVRWVLGDLQETRNK